MANLMYDTFTGTGDLSTHSPELNTWALESTYRFAILGPTDTGNPNLVLADMDLTGSGTVKATLNEASKDSIIHLKAGSAPSTYNYYMELTIDVPAWSGAPSLFEFYPTMGFRCSNPTVGSYLNALSVKWELFRHNSGYWQLSGYPAISGADTGSIVQDVPADWADYANMNMGSGAQTIVLKAVTNGRSVWLTVNGSAYGPATNPTWSGDTILDTGFYGIGLGYMNISGTGPDSVIDISSFLVAEYVGPFWENYILTEETTT